jgi:outer membrane immunogenic protein
MKFAARHPSLGWMRLLGLLPNTSPDSLLRGVGCSVSNEARLDSFATVRGRPGFTPWDRSLIYVTGGWAWTHGKDAVTATAGGLTATLIHLSASKSGWTLGGGWEQMIWEHWSAKLE